MKEPEIPHNETERLELIHQLGILQSGSEEIFSGITSIASIVCNTPVSVISIVDGERQCFKSAVGVDLKDTPRKYSFCAHAILGKSILEVPDSLEDERFKDNPLVTGSPYIRFYAGAPLELHNGIRVGTLCVIDHKPNKLNERQLQILHFLSIKASKLLDLRLKIKQVEALRENDKNIVSMLTHELRNPLTSINGYLSVTKMRKDQFNDQKYDALIDSCLKSTERMLCIVNEFLNYSHWKDGIWDLQKKENDINKCIRESAALTKSYTEKYKTNIELQLDESIGKLHFDYPSILNVLENLISNAAKHSPEAGKIIISSQVKGNFVQIGVRDFGPGIPDTIKDKLFKPFGLYNQENKLGVREIGLGLSIAKNTVEKHGGQLHFESAQNKGTFFYFSLPYPF